MKHLLMLSLTAILIVFSLIAGIVPKDSGVMYGMICYIYVKSIMDD